MVDILNNWIRKCPNFNNYERCSVRTPVSMEVSYEKNNSHFALCSRPDC